MYIVYLHRAYVLCIWQYYQYALSILLIVRVHHHMVSWLYILVAYKVSIYIPAIYTCYEHTSACFRTLVFAIFNILSRVYVVWILTVLTGFALFFWHVASCAVVKSALTQSSYLLVVSVFLGARARYIQPFFSAVTRV